MVMILSVIEYSPAKAIQYVYENPDASGLW